MDVVNVTGDSSGYVRSWMLFAMLVAAAVLSKPSIQTDSGVAPVSVMRSLGVVPMRILVGGAGDAGGLTVGVGAEVEVE